MTAVPDTALPLLAADRIGRGWDPVDVVQADGPLCGAVARRVGAGAVRRAEPGPVGPLLLEARLESGGLTLEVRGPADTPSWATERALHDLAAWVGADDDPSALTAVLSGHPVLAGIARRHGSVRLGALPTVHEALGRAVLEQLVQGVEARRSIRQVVAMAGAPAADRLRCWPTPTALGSTPAWRLRRCGVSLRAAKALHAGAVEARRLQRARREPAALDTRLLVLPGVGAWTSAKTRGALGDPDAVPVGDWNLPAVVCTALTGEDRGRTGWTDDDLLELLEPFAGQRARVIRLVTGAARARLLPRHARRAPRAALSAHRYW